MDEEHEHDWAAGLLLVLMVALALMCAGCTRLTVYGEDGRKLGEYVRPSWTDFEMELELTSGSLKVKTGSHLNETLVEIPATALRVAPGVM